MNTNVLRSLPWVRDADGVGVSLALLAALGFSLKAIFVKLAYPYGVGAVSLLALRMLIALPAFLYVAWQSRAQGEGWRRRDMAGVVVLGLLGYYGSSLLDFLGLQYISAALERLILFTYPTLAILIGVVAFGRQLSLREVGAIVLSYLGIGLAFAHDLQVTEDSRAVWIGGGFVFGSALTYGLYLAGSGALINRLGSARFTAWAMLVSTVGTLLSFAAVEQPAVLWQQPWQVYLWALCMAIFSTVLPVFMQSAAIRRIGPGRAVLIGTLGPILTLFFGWWWLGEAISGYQLLGAGFVLAGVLWVSRRKG